MPNVVRRAAACRTSTELDTLKVPRISHLVESSCVRFALIFWLRCAVFDRLSSLSSPSPTLCQLSPTDVLPYATALPVV